MKSMMGGTYWENVRRSFVPELISMNFMMAGMAPVMSFLMIGSDMRAMVPTELIFWGVMSVGVIAGFALAFPSNVWLVSKSLKHGLMTQCPSGTKFDLTNKGAAKAQTAHGGHAGHQMSVDQDHAAQAHDAHAARHDYGSRHSGRSHDRYGCGRSTTGQSDLRR